MTMTSYITLGISHRVHADSARYSPIWEHFNLMIDEALQPRMQMSEFQHDQHQMEDWSPSLGTITGKSQRKHTRHEDGGRSLLQLTTELTISMRINRVFAALLNGNREGAEASLRSARAFAEHTNNSSLIMQCMFVEGMIYAASGQHITACKLLLQSHLQNGKNELESDEMIRYLQSKAKHISELIERDFREENIMEIQELLDRPQVDSISDGTFGPSRKSRFVRERGSYDSRWKQERPTSARRLESVPEDWLSPYWDSALIAKTDGPAADVLGQFPGSEVIDSPARVSDGSDIFSKLLAETKVLCNTAVCDEPPLHTVDSVMNQQIKDAPKRKRERSTVGKGRREEEGKVVQETSRIQNRIPHPRRLTTRSR